MNLIVLLKVYSSVGFTARKICKALVHNDPHLGKYNYFHFFLYLAPQAYSREIFGAVSEIFMNIALRCLGNKEENTLTFKVIYVLFRLLIY